MTPDLSAIEAGFNKYGGQIFRKKVNEWDIKDLGILILKNVKKPVRMVKINGMSGPRPYTPEGQATGRGVQFTDRELIVRGSMYDFDWDPEAFRNTYLADESEKAMFQLAMEQLSDEYLAHFNDTTFYGGIYNSAGTGVVDIANGLEYYIDEALTASAITPVATGAITSSNAVTKLEQQHESLPVWQKKKGVRHIVSYDTLDKYTKHYRTLNGFSFDPKIVGSYKLDNKKGIIQPVSWLTGDEIITVVDGVIVLGLDRDSIEVHATKRRNIIEVRMMMELGLQISDLQGITVNDQVAA